MLEPKEQYDAYYQRADFAHSERRAIVFLRALLKKFSIVSEERHLLDLGCGTGFYANLFHTEFGFDVIGVDSSHVGLKKAIAFYGNSVKWIEADGCNLFFRNYFDVIFCSNFVPFSNAASLQEARRLAERILVYLKPGGVLLFIDTSSLDDKRHVGWHWMNYSLDSIRYIFGSLDNGKMLGLYATHMFLSPLIREHALSGIITKITSATIKLHSKRATIVCAVRREAENLPS